MTRYTCSNLQHHGAFNSKNVSVIKIVIFRLSVRRSSGQNSSALDPLELDWKLEPIARQRSAEIQAYLEQCRREESKVMKLLLLGRSHEKNFITLNPSSQHILNECH